MYSVCLCVCVRPQYPSTLTQPIDSDGNRNLELLSDEVDRMSSQLDRYKRFHTGGGGRPFMRDNRWGRRGREGAYIYVYIIPMWMDGWLAALD